MRTTGLSDRKEDWVELPTLEMEDTTESRVRSEDGPSEGTGGSDLTKGRVPSIEGYGREES